MARALGLALVGLMCACTVIDHAVPAKRAAREQAQKVQALQMGVMRFADEYVGRSREEMNRAQAEVKDPENRLWLQTWKLQQADAAYTIATGPNPVVNALDMAVLASLSRGVLNDSWVRDHYGDRARPQQQTYQSLETDAWQLLDGVLSDAQKGQLREIIATWRTQHPDVRAVAYIRFRDLAKSVGAPAAGEEQANSSLLSLLGIDPLTQLDPAVREITQTRQLAERSIYYIQRAPGLLDMQVERVTDQFAVMPETKALLGDLNRASLVGSASDQLVRTLPELLDRQREALFVQLTRSLNANSATMSSLARELRATLTAGTETANALHATLDSVERISKQFQPQPAASGSGDQGPPFDIRQYTQMLQEATRAARELNALAQQANSVTPVLHSATRDAADAARQTLDHLFLLLLLLVLATVVATLLAALTYRRMTARL